MTNVSDQNLHQSFLDLDKRHVLMITNHGIHQWDVIPGLPDTGGQNVFVNQFTETLAQFGFKITIVNRGGYPHPTTGEMRQGIHYRDERQRILYLEDETDTFVRKEDMDAQTPQLTSFLYEQLQAEETAVDLIISHYWDAAKIGVLLNHKLPQRVQHVWVPHSLGAVKKRNVKPERWQNLRIDERIAVEKSLIPELDGAAATSSMIRQSLKEDYGCDNILFLPPCVQTERIHPRTIEPNHPIWKFLGDHAGLAPADVQERLLVTEISRTDTTKRKDVLIKAMAQVREQVPEAMLVVSIDETEKELAAELNGLISELGLEEHTAVLGNVWEQLPDIYAVTAVYCSPSIMEGFGMSVQEAAATKVPVVSSDLVPFVLEYLLGNEVEQLTYEGMDERPLRQGEGAIVVPADDIDGFAAALTRLLSNLTLCQEMGERAYDITIPYFTWKDMTRRFLETIGETE